MAIGLKTKSDIQFTRNVLESLGEWERAARMARAMIDRYSARSDSQDVVNAYREILISAMDEGGVPSEERAAEYDKLFAGYLTVRDRASAAKVLLALVELWRAEDSTAALVAADKCIDLFRDNVDPNVVTQVHEAFAFRFGLTEEDDPDFVPECVYPEDTDAQLLSRRLRGDLHAYPPWFWK